MNEREVCNLHLQKIKDKKFKIKIYKALITKAFRHTRGEQGSKDTTTAVSLVLKSLIFIAHFGLNIMTRAIVYLI